MTTRTPTLFLSHGAPTLPIDPSLPSGGFTVLSEHLPRPRSVLMLSAHWGTMRPAVSTATKPETIHDFYGFPRALYEIQYPAPGAPDLARRLHMVLSPIAVRLDESWGLDHGTWSVLRHVYPDADVPVIQFSIDETRPARFHYELGARLSPLRDEGILIAGSGNLVHNLHTYAWGRHPAEPYEWAVRFEERARALMQVGDHDPLIGYEALGRDAQLSIPTPEHYLPLLYVLGAQQPGDAVSFPVEGVDGGSISMLAVKVG